MSTPDRPRFSKLQRPPAAIPVDANQTDVARALLAASDAALRDASTECLSQRGTWDATFEAGYLALLSVLAPIERESGEHPNEIAVQLGSERLGVNAELGLRLLRARYLVEPPDPVAEVNLWSEQVRASARARISTSCRS